MTDAAETKLTLYAIHPTEAPRHVAITDKPWAEIDIAQDWLPSLFYGYGTVEGDGPTFDFDGWDNWHLIAIDGKGTPIDSTLSYPRVPGVERADQFVMDVQAFVDEMAEASQT